MNSEGSGEKRAIATTWRTYLAIENCKFLLSEVVVFDFMKMSNGQGNDQRDCSPDSSQQQSLMGQRQEVEGVETKLRGKIWTGDAVVLRLRGGGSSRLRKQARERKFDQLGFKNHDSGQLSASELKEGKTMRPLESLHLEEVLSKPKSGDTLTMAPGLRETSEKTTEVEASAQKSAFKKASRFIVFIGSFPIEYAWFFKLMIQLQGTYPSLPRTIP